MSLIASVKIVNLIERTSFFCSIVLCLVYLLTCSIFRQHLLSLFFVTEIRFLGKIHLAGNSEFTKRPLVLEEAV